MVIVYFLHTPIFSQKFYDNYVFFCVYWQALVPIRLRPAATHLLVNPLDAVDYHTLALNLDALDNSL